MLLALATPKLCERFSLARVSPRPLYREQIYCGGWHNTSSHAPQGQGVPANPTSPQGHPYLLYSVRELFCELQIFLPHQTHLPRGSGRTGPNRGLTAGSTPTSASSRPFSSLLVRRVDFLSNPLTAEPFV